MNTFLDEINVLKNQNTIELSRIIKAIQTKLECSPKHIWKTIRLVLTGENHGPSLNDIINMSPNIPNTIPITSVNNNITNSINNSRFIV